MRSEVIPSIGTSRRDRSTNCGQESATPAIDAAMVQMAASAKTLDDLRAGHSDAPFLEISGDGVALAKAHVAKSEEYQRTPLMTSPSDVTVRKQTLSQRWNRLLIRLGTWLRKLGGA